MRTPTNNQPFSEQIDELLTISEVAKLLRVDSTTIRRLCDNGAIEAVTLQSRTSNYRWRRIKRSVVEHGLKTGKYVAPAEEE